MQLARCDRTLATCLVLGILVSACGGSAPPVRRPAETPPPDSQTPPTGGTESNRRGWSFRFSMLRPANSDFAFNNDDVFIYVRPFADHLSFKIQARTQNHIRILWQDTVFTDILGRRYMVVPPTIPFEQAVFGIPPLDVPDGQVWSGRLTLLDPADRAAIGRLGGEAAPVVPPDAGTLEQMRGQVFYLDLALELNNIRQDYPFEFEIKDAFFR